MVQEMTDYIKKAKEVIEEAKKLSTKKRKSLPDSSFCGPGRSYPVNDCSHYTAALRLLNRSKYSDSTKKKIRACINRKGKSLGCSGADKEKADYSTYISKELKEVIDSAEFASTVKSVEESIKNPGMDLFKGCCEKSR